MKQRGDAVTGLVLAFVGIALLMAWRTGALKALISGDLYGSSSVQKEGTGLRSAIDALGNSAPAISTRSAQGPGSAVATSGVPEDGYSSTRAPMIATWTGAAGGWLDESARAARRAASTIYTPIDQSIRDRMQTLEYEFRPLISPASTSIDSSAVPGGGSASSSFLVP